jgi:hypothetical protein
LRRALISISLAGALMAAGSMPSASAAPVVGWSDRSGGRPNCSENSVVCTEIADPIGYDGHSTGHDEPSVLFYDSHDGSGNSSLYQLKLPTDPPTPPAQDGSGGTFNFQLHPAFWFGMAMCDNQSSPEYTHAPCVPDSDINIFNSADPNSPRYIGRHPGTAFMEMQFYPPGWVPRPAGNSCDATRWCAALNIDSLSIDHNHGLNNNADCRGAAGDEPVNFAYVTNSGVATSAANPLNPGRFNLDASKDLFMNSGDKLDVSMFDTSAGFKVDVQDLTTGHSGSMTASTGNGFAQVNFDPNATTCTASPYAFHPMYATSSPQTRVPWAAHSYNVSYSDEIGHFEYCNQVDAQGGNCTQSSTPSDPPATDSDDYGCYTSDQSTRIRIGGCPGADGDFDGPAYQTSWPGTIGKQVIDGRYNPTPIRFTSPLYRAVQGGAANYERVGFETDLPRIELATTPPCDRDTGNGCVDPPAGVQFYPFFTTGRLADGTCTWQEGGAAIPGTTRDLGGSSTAEFGGLLRLFYPGPGFHPVYRYNDFRRILTSNPCPQAVPRA